MMYTQTSCGVYSVFPNIPNVSVISEYFQCCLDAITAFFCF